VLPATLALGAVLNVAEAATGAPIGTLRSFRVFKGVVLDANGPVGLRLAVGAAGKGAPGELDVVVSAVDAAGTSRPAYGAIVDTATPARTADRTDLAAAAAAANGSDADGFYRDGTLFHGPALRGLRKVLERSAERVLLTARLAGAEPARGAYTASLHRPAQTDLLLQAGLVWVRLFHGAASLPLEIERVTQYAPLPVDQDFLIAVEQVVPGKGGVTAKVTACDPDGRVLQVLEGVLLVEDLELEQKFRQSSGLGALTA
jgi:hypothetical protein